MAPKSVLIALVVNVFVAGGYSVGALGSWQDSGFNFKRASSSSICNTNTTISSQSDIDAISNCTTFNNTLTILGPETVTLPNLSILKGDLIISVSSTVVNFAADSLTRIVGRGYSWGLNVDSPPMLKTLSLKSLQNVTGQIYIVNASALTNLDMPVLVNLTQRVLIAQTGLQNLDLPELKEFLYPFGATYNKPTYFWGEYNPLGTSTGMSISLNSRLSRVWFPGIEDLTTWFQVLDNPNLKNFTLPNLETIGASSVVLNGTFENITFPYLDSVLGTFTIRTTYENFSCSNFGPFRAACTANAPFGPAGANSTNRYSYTSESNRKEGGSLALDTGQIVGIVLGSILGLVLGLVMCSCCCCNTESQKAKRQEELAARTGTGMGTATQDLELRNTMLETSHRVAVDDAFSARHSTSASPPGYAEAMDPVTGTQRPPAYRNSSS